MMLSTPTSTPGARPSWLKVSADIQFEIEQLVYHEAALLDEGRFEEWLELFDAAIHYRMYTHVNQREYDARRSTIPSKSLPLYDDTLDSLRMRVRRLEDGSAWAEEPRTRTRRLVTNVRIEPIAEGEYRVRTNFITYCSRRERDEHSYIGSRQDILARSIGALGWSVKDRHIQLEQSVLLAPNISVFF